MENESTLSSSQNGEINSAVKEFSAAVCGLGHSLRLYSAVWQKRPRSSCVLCTVEDFFKYQDHYSIATVHTHDSDHEITQMFQVRKVCFLIAACGEVLFWHTTEVCGVYINRITPSKDMRERWHCDLHSLIIVFLSYREGVNFLLKRK